MTDSHKNEKRASKRKHSVRLRQQVNEFDFDREIIDHRFTIFLQLESHCPHQECRATAAVQLQRIIFLSCYFW